MAITVKAAAPFSWFGQSYLEGDTVDTAGYDGNSMRRLLRLAPVYVESAASLPPVLLGVGDQVPGAAQASHILAGLASATPLASLLDASSAPLGSAAAATDGSVVIAGVFPTADTFIGHPLHAIYRSTDGGATFTGISTPLDAALASGGSVINVAFGAAGQVLASGVDGSGNNAVIHSTDSGLTWALVTTPLGGVPADVGFASPSVGWDGTVWCLGVFTALTGVGLWTSPDLVTWTPRTTGMDNESVSYISCSGGVIIATGGTSSGTVLARSVDHGATFTNPAVPFTNYAPYVVPDGAGHWLGWNITGAPGTAQSLDGGATWGAIVTLPAFASLVAGCFLAGTGWVSAWGAGRGCITYTAPVAEPLVWTPVGYIPDSISSPVVLLPV